MSKDFDEKDEYIDDYIQKGYHKEDFSLWRSIVGLFKYLLRLLGF